jgi:homogentisate 1,2-dioxygenase
VSVILFCQQLETHDEKGDFLIKIKKEGMMHEVVYASHPFDVGWDGYNFPYGFSIHNFEPITGRPSTATGPSNI